MSKDRCYPILKHTHNMYENCVHLYVKPDKELILYILAEKSPIFGQIYGHGDSESNLCVLNVRLAVDRLRTCSDPIVFTFHTLNCTPRTYSHITFPLSNIASFPTVDAPCRPPGFVQSKIPAMTVFDPLTFSYV